MALDGGSENLHSYMNMPLRKGEVRLSTKGRVVIPAPTRRVLDLRVGQAFRISAGPGRTVHLEAASGEVRDLRRMLERSRAWARATGRDFVEELHEARRRERAALGIGPKRRRP